MVAVHAYSNFGLRIDLYARSFRFLWQFLRFLRRIPSIVFPLAVTLFTWEFHFMSADNSTPKYDVLYVSFSNTPSSSYPKTIFFCRARFALIMLHLAMLNLSCHLSSHSCSLLRSSWKTLQSWTLAIYLYITQSSANRRTVDDVCSAKSLIRIRKSSSPNTEPCSTPDFTAAASDVSPSTTTLCVRPSKNYLIHFCKPFVIP